MASLVFNIFLIVSSRQGKPVIFAHFLPINNLCCMLNTVKTTSTLFIGRVYALNFWTKKTTLDNTFTWTFRNKKIISWQISLNSSVLCETNQVLFGTTMHMKKFSALTPGTASSYVTKNLYWAWICWLPKTYSVLSVRIPGSRGFIQLKFRMLGFRNSEVSRYQASKVWYILLNTLPYGV
jgi:hypothetical protein